MHTRTIPYPASCVKLHYTFIVSSSTPVLMHSKCTIRVCKYSSHMCAPRAYDVVTKHL